MTTLGDLSAAELLAAEESGVRLKRQAEVDGLLRLLAWCDLHSVDPQGRPGGDRLVRLGGEGTPETSELCLAEFAVASHAGWIATSHRAAAALDLRHRLPRLWERVQRLDVEVWVARKIADLSRKLSRAAVEIVDISVAAARDLTPGKLIELAEARVIEADPAAHRERIAAEEARIGVFARRRRPGDAVVDIDGQAGVQPITLRLPTAGAVLWAGPLASGVDRRFFAKAAIASPRDLATAAWIANLSTQMWNRPRTRAESNPEARGESTRA